MRCDSCSHYCVCDGIKGYNYCEFYVNKSHCKNVLCETCFHKEVCTMDKIKNKCDNYVSDTMIIVEDY